MSNISTFGTFTMIKLGIYAAQQGFSVTGNNVANINTNGYTRQALDQKSMYVSGADKYVSTNDIHMGYGALVTGVSQLRDPFLDIQYRNEMANVGAMEGKLKGLNRLASVLDEVYKGEDGEGVIEAQINDVIEQLQNLVTQGAGLDEYDTLVRSSVDSLCGKFHHYATQLENVYNEQAEEFDQNIEKVNTLLTNIRNLNSQIRRANIYGSDALELKDERNLLIDELSEYMRISVLYSEEPLGAGQSVEKLTIKLAGNNGQDPYNNAVLIDGVYGTQLKVEGVKTLVKNPDYDANDPTQGPEDIEQDLPNEEKTYDIVLETLKDKNGLEIQKTDPLYPDGTTALSDTTLYGSLQAQRELLTEKGEYALTTDVAHDPDATSKRGIQYYQYALDALANKFAEVFNQVNMAEKIKGPVEGPIDQTTLDATYGTIELPKNSGIRYATKQSTTGGDTKTYFAVTDDCPLAEDDDRLLVPEDGRINSDIAAYLKVVTDELDAAGVPTGKYFVKGNVERSGVLLSSGGDDPEGVTASNISIAQKWSTGEVRIVRSWTSTNSTANDNLRHLLTLMDTGVHEFKPGDTRGSENDGQAIIAENQTYYRGTLQGMLTNMNEQLANDMVVTDTMLSNHYTTADSLWVDRDAVSGVDLNDEAMNMMQYQKAYAASCRLMTTFDEMLDKLINGTAI